MIAVEHPHELEHSKARPIAPMPPTSACDAPSPMHSQDCPLHRVANQKVLQMVREKGGVGLDCDINVSRSPRNDTRPKKCQPSIVAMNTDNHTSHASILHQAWCPADGRPSALP